MIEEGDHVSDEHGVVHIVWYEYDDYAHTDKLFDTMCDWTFEYNDPHEIVDLPPTCIACLAWDIKMMWRRADAEPATEAEEEAAWESP